MCMMLRDVVLCQRSLRPWEEVGVVTEKRGAGQNWVEGGAKSELGGPHALHSPSFQMYGRPSASPWSVSWAAVRAVAEQRLF